MEIVYVVADWIRFIGSIASVGLAIYFIVTTIKKHNLAKKPMRDAKKRKKAMAELVSLAHDLGLEVSENVKKTDK